MSDWTQATPEHVADLIDRYSGRSGDAFSETIWNFGKGDDALGYVTVCSSRGVDVANMLRRCGSGLLAFREHDADGGTIFLRFRADAVREPWMVLKPLDVESKPFTRPEAATA